MLGGDFERYRTEERTKRVPSYFKATIDLTTEREKSVPSKSWPGSG
jgi:hypothetical protein